MANNTTFSQVIIRVADNGFIVDIEGEDEDKTYVYTSLRITLRELRKLLGVNGSEE